MKRSFTIILTLAFSYLMSCQHDPIYPVGQAPSDVPTNSLACDPDTTYFQNEILPILVSNCTYAGCHNEPYGQDGIILTNYALIMQSGQVNPGRSGNSDLYEVLNESRDDKRMPPPPYARLSSDQIAKVRKWIDQGALNNQCEENTTDCDTISVPFNAVQTILNTNCIGCHSGGSASGNVNLETYASIRIHAANGRLTGAINHSVGFAVMPPGTSLPACDIMKIEAWINQGMNP